MSTWKANYETAGWILLQTEPACGTRKGLILNPNAIAVPAQSIELLMGSAADSHCTDENYFGKSRQRKEKGYCNEIQD